MRFFYSDSDPDSYDLEPHVKFSECENIEDHRGEERLNYPPSFDSGKQQFQSKLVAHIDIYKLAVIYDFEKLFESAQFQIESDVEDKERSTVEDILEGVAFAYGSNLLDLTDYLLGIIVAERKYELEKFASGPGHFDPVKRLIEIVKRRPKFRSFKSWLSQRLSSVYFRY